MNWFELSQNKKLNDLCSTSKSYSQVNIYHYALQMVSIHFEFTFVLLRYLLGAIRPKQTTH